MPFTALPISSLRAATVRKRFPSRSRFRVSRSLTVAARTASAFIGLICTFTFATSAYGHPLGNDSVTHFSVLHILPDHFQLDLVLDIAEYPATQIGRDEMDTDQDGRVSTDEQHAWLDKTAPGFATQVGVLLDGQPLTLKPVDAIFDPQTGKRVGNGRVIVESPGVGGVPTYKIIARYEASYPVPLGEAVHTFAYEDNTYPDKQGLMRILLDRTGVVGQMSNVDPQVRDDLDAGKIHPALRAFLEGKGLAPSPQAAVHPTTGPTGWTLRDQAGQWHIEASGTTLSVYSFPRVVIDQPRPPFWDENALSPFIYDQYDPGNLPVEKSTTFQFRVQTTAGQPVRPTMPDTQPETAVAEPATQPTAATHPAYTLDRILVQITDPHNDPSRTNQAARDAGWLIDQLRRPWGLGLFLSITAVCFAWGAGHALMPGHAKTLVAAYLISQHGTRWHAVLLAIVVTITHTALVVIMGVIMYVYEKSNPTLAPRIQLWLGAIAGLLVAGMGISLIWRAVANRIDHHHNHHHHHHHDEPRSWWRKLFTHSHPHPHGHEHPHAHEHDHDHGHTHSHDHHHGHHHAHDEPHAHHHHDHDHAHGHGHHHHDHAHPHHHHGAQTEPTGDPAAAKAKAKPGDPWEANRLTTRTLVVMGISGGIVPCPTATIIMLLGIGANVVLGALYAVGVFSLGLALTLMVIGLLALGSRKFAAKLLSDESHPRTAGWGRWLLMRALPACSGLVVLALGAAIAMHYFYFLRMGRGLFAWLQ